MSVCISVYNTEKYLPRCLDSVIAQTLHSLEIVLVNNGSTDSSEAIMRQYESNHPERKFIIVSQEDRGLAQGRQSGVNVATGQYITFLDADDYVYPSAYQKMYEAGVKNNADIIEIETVRDGNIISSPYEGLKDSHSVLNRYFKKNDLPSMLWMRMYHRNLFEKPVFPKLYTNNEDMFGLPCLLHAAKSVYFLKEPLHVYSVDNELAVMSNLKKKKDEKYFKARSKALYAVPFVEKYIGEKYINNEYSESFFFYKSRIIIGFLFYRFAEIGYKNRIDAVKEVLGLSSVPETEQVIRKLARKDGIGRLIKSIGVQNTFKLYQLFKRV